MTVSEYRKTVQWEQLREKLKKELPDVYAKSDAPYEEWMPLLIKRRLRNAVEDGTVKEVPAMFAELPVDDAYGIINRWAHESPFAIEVICRDGYTHDNMNDVKEELENAFLGEKTWT